MNKKLNWLKLFVFSEDNLVGIMLMPVLVLLAGIIIGYRWDLSLWMALKWGLLVGSILYCLGVLPFWNTVDSNTGQIWQNRLMPVPPPVTDLQITNTDEPPVEQIARQAGTFFILWWYKKLGDPIPMVNNDNLTETVKVIDSVNLGYKIKIVVPLNPAPGRWLTNYKRVSDGAARQHLLAILSQKIEQKLKKETGEWAITNLGDFQKWFSKVLGGPNALSETEKKVGRFTGVINATIEPEADTQKILQQQESVRRVTASVVEAKTKLPTLNETIAFGLGMAKEGVGESVKVNMFSGLEGLVGLTHLNLGGEQQQRGQGQRGGGQGSNRGNRGGNQNPPANPPAPPVTPPTTP